MNENKTDKVNMDFDDSVSYRIVDADFSGNVVRIYLGPIWRHDYWGDDWDDAPYEHNAGIVYPEFVTAMLDVAFKFDCAVVEPCDGELNSSWCKKDMIEQRVPRFVVCDYKYLDSSWYADNFSYVVSNGHAVRVYLDTVVTVQEILDMFGGLILGFAVSYLDKSSDSFDAEIDA